MGEKVDKAGSREAGHAFYLTLLERHLDGDLDAGGREVLFEHMENCDACREILEAEERLADRLAQIPRISPPSDLRANILRELERERRETEPVHTDERYAEMLAGHPAARRTTWQRYSPAFAMVFLVIATLGWFLSGQAGSLQSVITRTIARAGSAVTRVAAPVAVREMPKPVPLLAATPVPMATPTPMPPEAEKAKPTLAAIVLRPTDLDGGMSLDSDKVDRAIRETAQRIEPTAPARHEQFVFDGHRYRCYELQVAESTMQNLIASLDAYRAPADPPILYAITEQGGVGLPPHVDFFAAPRTVLHDAVLNLPAAESQPSEGRKHVRIFVVD